MNTTRIILASASAQRAEILTQCGILFDQLAVDICESFIGSDPVENAVRIAGLKAREAARLAPERIILAADTFIVHHGHFLGKPVDRDQARDYLKRLGGTSHSVISGYCVIIPGEKHCRQGFDTSLVEFLPLSDARIDSYLQTGEWKGAAGAYRIQQKGALLVKGISGSYQNVVGLPIVRIYGILEQFITSL